MAAFAGAASLVAPAIPMIAPPHGGTYGSKLQRRMATSRGVLALVSRNQKSKLNVSLVCSSHKPISVVTLSGRNQFGSPPLGDAGLTSSCPSATFPVLPQCRRMRTIASRASSSIPYNFSGPSTEQKPRWWWRTIACIPYLMPLHMMSMYAAGAHRFVPFLENFEILVDPFFGAQLPQWFSIVYCLGIYFLVVRRKTWPRFFRFHVIMAMLLENAIQIIGTVAGWMPYWNSLDAPFWTVVAYGLLFAICVCIRDSLNGTYPDIPFFSEAAHMHTSLP